MSDCAVGKRLRCVPYHSINATKVQRNAGVGQQLTVR